MKKYFNTIKWSRILWILSGVVILYTCVSAINFNSKQKLTQFILQSDNNTGLLFIEKADVLQLLQDMKVKPSSNTLKEINCNKIEKKLESNPFIENAEVYIDALANLHAEVQQRVPVLRIINRNAVSFYIDSKGNRMPLSSKFTARVAVVSGNVLINDNNADTTDIKLLKDLHQLSNYLQKDTFMQHLVEQVWINEQKEMIIIPKFNNQEILFGSIEDLDWKMKKLKYFYQNTINNTCSNYKRINLTYKNEIVADRKDYIPQAPTTPVQKIESIPDTIKTPNKL